MKQVTIVMISLESLIGILLLNSKSHSFLGSLFFVPTALGPLFINLVVATFLSIRRAQTALLISSMLYGVYFGYAYLDIFYFNVDAQGALGLLLVGPISLPVMAAFWIVVGKLQASSLHPE